MRAKKCKKRVAPEGTARFIILLLMKKVDTFFIKLHLDVVCQDVAYADDARHRGRPPHAP